MGKVRNIFAINVGRYTKNAHAQRAAFMVAKSILNKGTQRLHAS